MPAIGYVTMKNTDKLTDDDLLEGLLQSDGKAIQGIYDLVLPSIIIWIKQNKGSEEDARDVFQEALIALYQKVQETDFKLTCTLKSYLRVVCRNLWLARIRNKNFQNSSLLEGIEAVALDQDMEKRIEASERDQLFFKYFDQLDEKCQQILKWQFDKIPFKEIARRLDTTENYIKKRKFYCKERLIKWIKADSLYAQLL